MSTANAGHLPKKRRQAEKKGMDAISQKWILIGLAAATLLIIAVGASAMAINHILQKQEVRRIEQSEKDFADAMKNYSWK